MYNNILLYNTVTNQFLLQRLSLYVYRLFDKQIQLQFGRPQQRQSWFVKNQPHRRCTLGCVIVLYGIYIYNL